jgi:hypothetical protein
MLFVGPCLHLPLDTFKLECAEKAIQEFAMGNKKDFLDGWWIHVWGALANSFGCTFTKWLM